MRYTTEQTSIHTDVLMYIYDLAINPVVRISSYRHVHPYARTLVRAQCMHLGEALQEIYNQGSDIASYIVAPFTV